MCKPGETRDVLVKIPEDLSASGLIEFKSKKIDKCIASIVNILQRGGIDMRGSCCGHNKGVGEIHLQDGRVLVVMYYTEFDKYKSIINALMIAEEVKNGG